jgi:competence protein ComEC
MVLTHSTFVSWPHQPMVRIMLLFSAGILLAPKVNGFATPIYLVCICFILLLALLLAQSIQSRTQRFRLFKGTLSSLCICLLGILSASVRAPESNVTYWIPKYNTHIYCILEVLPEPVLKNGVYRFNCSLIAVFKDKKFERATGIVRCSLPDSLGLSPLTGDQILLNGWVQLPNRERLPGLFSMQNWLNDQGIVAELKPRTAKLLNAGNPSNLFRRSMINWRKRLIALLQQNGLSANELAVGSALILGERSEIDREVLANYTSSGIVHILAVSGLHVGLIYAGLLLLIGRIKRFKNSLVGLLFCLSALWLYAFITGLSPSVLRASVMYSFIAFARLKKNPVSPFNALAASAFILLCADPWIYKNTGFQLSFAAVWGIISFAGIVDKLSSFSSVKWIRYMGLSAGVSCSAQLATLPITLHLFGTFPVYFLITNLIAIPVSTFLTYIGIASVVTAPISYIGFWLTWGFGKGIQFLNLIASTMSGLPGSIINNLYINRIEMVLGLLAIFQLALIFRSFTQKKGMLLLFLILLLSLTGLVNSISRLTSKQLLLFKRKDSVHAVFIHQGKAFHFHSKTEPEELIKIQAELRTSINAVYGIDAVESSVQVALNSRSFAPKMVDVAGNYFVFNTEFSAEKPIQRLSKPLWLVINHSTAKPKHFIEYSYFAGVILFPTVSKRAAKFWSDWAAKSRIDCFIVTSSNYVLIDLG